MKVISNNSKLLDEIYNDLEKKNIETNKVTKKVEGAMGDITTYISLGVLGLDTIAIFLNYLTFRQNQKKNYLHFKYKNGLEIKFDNLSKLERDLKIKKIEIDFSQLEYIHIG